MSRRNPKIAFVAVLLVLTVACPNKKSANPLANVGSKQPDKVLFDKAMDAMRHNRFDVARITLQTLINAYPDSEYIARAIKSLPTPLSPVNSTVAREGPTRSIAAKISCIAGLRPTILSNS